MLRIFLRAYTVMVDDQNNEVTVFDPQWEATNYRHTNLERLQEDPAYFEPEEEEGYMLLPLLDDSSLRALQALLDNTCNADGVTAICDFFDYHAFDPENPYGHREDTADPKEEGIKTLDTILRTLRNLGEENDLISPDQLGIFIAECEDCKRRLQIIDAAGMTFLLRVVDLSLV